VGAGFDLHPQGALLRRHDRKRPRPSTDIAGARVLAVLGDSVTTDHISPAGNIKANGPAGKISRRAWREAGRLQQLRLAPRQS
jgi:aconitase A